ncbi:class I SAM-dependent methyltransferase [Halomonas koreensis]|uniref:Class I SAM-dependent methyltransferase n=1 Tax=Halomonas koreensis TaxID=245385 RepID=A0ABU1G3J0_9GAMM|nr:class I SAM-dependent methyltransferase [Halomonas koreensis]MDR5867508.1 class I SAM-dependent methyltransferase [Halomonas koreensis]
MMPTCPLCASPHPVAYHRDARRDYLQCRQCELVFVPAEQRLGPDEEKAVYDRHENSPDDPGYRRFLSRLFEPLAARLPPGARGLDFGAGPGPTLSVMFEEVGHPMAIYDPFYAPDRRALAARYDFITATEVVEHLFAPGAELERLAGLLAPGGWLGLMTKRVRSAEAFAGWHYILDPTHVCFFSEASFRWLAARLDMAVSFPSDDVALLQRRDSPGDP